MARGRIFSSRRMFSSRRSSFAEPSRNAGPFGVMLGLTAAAIIIFVIGVLVGRSFPNAVPEVSPAFAPLSPSEPVRLGVPEIVDGLVLPDEDEAPVDESDINAADNNSPQIDPPAATEN